MLSKKVINHLEKSSAIRAMFEDGEILKQKYGADKVFDFSIGNPDIEPPVKVKQTLKQIILDDRPGIHGYMNNAGHTDVRMKIAEHLNKENKCSLSYKNIVMTCGAGSAMNVILKAILNPEEEVIVFSPYFVEYYFYIDNHGGKMVVVPTNKDTFQIDLLELERNISFKTKAIILNSPNNPTGVVYSKELLTDISKLLETKEKEYNSKIFVISDEPYRDIVYDGLALPKILDIFKNSILAYSFSKSHSLPGERIGYIAASQYIDCIDMLMDAMVFANRSLGYVNAPSLFQKVVAESLESKVDVSIYRERRDLLYNHLIKLGFSCVKPQGAFFLFPKSPIPDVNELKNRALQHNIIIVPGKGFGFPNNFRLAYCMNIKNIENSFHAFNSLAKELNLQ